MKKLVIMIVITMMLSGCISEKPTDTSELSPDVLSTVTGPVMTPDSPSPSETYISPDYNLEKSLPYGRYTLLKGDEYYFISKNDKDETVDVYCYTKKTDKINLYRDTDSEYIGQILFDGSDSFCYLDWDTDILYKCNEDNDAPVIYNIRFVTYIKGRHIYYYDTHGYLNKYNIEDNSVVQIAYLGDAFYQHYSNQELINECLLNKSIGLYSVDMRNGNIKKILDGNCLYTEDKTFIVCMEKTNDGTFITILDAENLGKVELYIDEKFIEETIISAPVIMSDKLYIITEKNITKDRNRFEDQYSNYIYFIDLNRNTIENKKFILESGTEGIESTSFYNGKLYFYYCSNYDDGLSPEILEYDVETGEEKKIKINKYDNDFVGYIEIKLGHIWVYNISYDGDILFMAKIKI